MTKLAFPVILMLVMVLSACATPMPSAPALPTNTPMPTFTPTPEVVVAPVDPNAAATALAIEAAATAAAAPQPAPEQAEDTEQAGEAEQPTPTPEQPATPTPASDPAVIVGQNMNVRGGPGTNYSIVGAATAGQRYVITGRNTQGDWWQINFNGRPGWVYGPLVTAQNTDSVTIAANIPAPPPPPNTPVPAQPTPVPPPPPAEPAPAPAEPQPAPAEPQPAPASNYPFVLIDNYVDCRPNPGFTYFDGFVRYRDNSLRNGVCIQIDYFGPRNTKCSGCDGVGDGVWGFSPFGGPAPVGTTVEIYVVQCPGPMPAGGMTQQSGFGDLTPQSPKWVRTVTESVECHGITFVGD